MKKLMMMAMVVGLAWGMAQGASFKAATIQEMAKYGATHILEWSHADLTGTSTNATLTFTNTLTGPVSVKFEGYLLDQTFDTKLYTNAVGGLAVSVGDTSSATKWISALEVATDATPTYYASFGTDYTVTTIGSATNAMVSTVTSPWVNAQTGNVSVVTTFAMTGETITMGSLDRGALRTFWRVLSPKYDR